MTKLEQLNQAIQIYQWRRLVVSVVEQTKPKRYSSYALSLWINRLHQACVFPPAWTPPIALLEQHNK
jgi:hypothetical protein